MEKERISAEIAANIDSLLKANDKKSIELVYALTGILASEKAKERNTMQSIVYDIVINGSEHLDKILRAFLNGFLKNKGKA